MITYNNTAKLLNTQQRGNDILNLKTKSTQVTSDTDFKSFLDKNLNNASKSSNQNNISRNDKDISQKSESVPKYKSFRELSVEKKSNDTTDSVKKTTEGSKSQNVDSDTKELCSQEYDEQINVLAQMLGLQPSELMKLAKELGFTAEDLKDLKKLTIFLSKLDILLELNDSQETMLNTVAAEVMKQVETESNPKEISSLEISSNIEVEAKANTIDDTKTVDLSKIADSVKEKLNQLIQNATANPETVGSEISKVIEVMRSQIQAKIIVNSEQVASKDVTADITETLPNSEQLSVEETATTKKEFKNSSNSADGNNAESTDTSETKTEVSGISVNTQTNTTSDQNQQLDMPNELTLGDVKIGMSNSQVDIQKTAFTMPKTVKSSEVINQVVEQAKVIIGQDKSEMVIHLKPDHLGKLELKVVTEQGIVAAKFIAESQQVKEIIETNMQLLKDSLQKQGISVESINVQVGQDKQSEYQQQSSYQSKNNSSSNKQRYGNNELGISKIGINAFDTLPEKLAQYSYESNTINLTA